jgi:hypothetical protein
VAGEDLLRHGHGPRAGVGARQLDLAGRQRLGEREQPALPDHQLRDRVVPAGELLQGDALAGLEAPELAVVAHEHALVDVVAGVDRGEGDRDGDPDAGPLLRLHRGLAGAAHPLAIAGDDHLEVAVDQGVALEQPLAVDDQPGVGVAGQVLGPVAEADPGRGHGVRVDVVQQVVDRQALHAEVQLAGKLAPDQLRILGQEEDPLAGGQTDDFGGLHPRSFSSRHPIV